MSMVLLRPQADYYCLQTRISPFISYMHVRVIKYLVLLSVLRLIHINGYQFDVEQSINL